jgi:hypothetical protein
MRVPTTRKLERQSNYVRKMINETEFINFTKLSESIFTKKSKMLHLEGALGDNEEDEQMLEIYPSENHNSEQLNPNQNKRASKMLKREGKPEVGQEHEEEEEEEEVM